MGKYGQSPRSYLLKNRSKSKPLEENNFRLICNTVDLPTTMGQTTVHLYPIQSKRADSIHIFSGSKINTCSKLVSTGSEVRAIPYYAPNQTQHSVFYQ